MELTKIQEKIWDQVKTELADEPVASPDHVERMTAWCQLLGPKMGADMEVLLAGALLHDVGVVINRKNHYTVGRARAAEILKEVGFPEEKIEDALHVLTRLFAMYEELEHSTPDNESSSLFFRNPATAVSQASECNLNRR